MTNQTPPALSDDELRETLDMIGTVVASVSDRVDAQTDALDRLNKTTTEARQAAFAAQRQTDPEFYGQIVGEVALKLIERSLADLKGTISDLDRQTRQTITVLKQKDDDRDRDRKTLTERERRIDAFKAKLPWMTFAVGVFAMVMTLTVPRFIAQFPSGCGVLGGTWTETSASSYVCAFFNRS
ncbi:hypothetical protein [Loktanella sp. M215]|uniref:hypothetical protein n=2 Tax=Loktanella sp. M215 TaxID=2675431 RepID=UPI001F42A43B|nr:hypothetical protein [Loktanella sp. M215]MCF7701504.1 hypothetical protein [Loktanella sp. M215]